MEKGSKKKMVIIVVIVVAVIALLVGGAFAVKTIMEKNETQKSEKSDDTVNKEKVPEKNVITEETPKITEETPETVEETPSAIETPQTNTTATEDSIKVGNSVLKYGKYKADFDVPTADAYITINSDGTATYAGDRIQSNGKFIKVNLTGTWETKEDAITMSAYDKNKYAGVCFKWSNGESEAFAIGNDMFGDQWHSFDLVK